MDYISLLDEKSNPFLGVIFLFFIMFFYLYKISTAAIFLPTIYGKFQIINFLLIFSGKQHFQ